MWRWRIEQVPRESRRQQPAPAARRLIRYRADGARAQKLFLRNLFACFNCDCDWLDFTQTSSGQQSLVLRTTVGPAPVDGTAITIAGSLSSNKQGPHGMRACCAGAGANGGGGCSLLLVHSLALDGGGGGELTFNF